MTSGRWWIAARSLALLGMASALLLAAATAAQAAAPANDGFAQATFLADPEVSVSGTTVEATEEAGEPDHAGVSGGSSVWYSWTAPSSGPVTISTCPYTELHPDTVLAVYTGATLGDLTPVASSDDSPVACKPFGSEVELEVTAGTTYRIAVDSRGAEGIFSLDIEFPPTNDSFAAAKPLSFFGGGGSTVFATKEPGEPDHAGSPGGHSLWFSWTPTESGPVEFYACGVDVDVDTLLAVYSGDSLGALTPIASNDDAAGGREFGLCEPQAGYSEVGFDAVAGTTYRVAVDTKLPGDVSLSFERAPDNDAFANARVLDAELSPWPAGGSNRMASEEVGEPDHAGGAGGRSVWFSWTAPSSGPLHVTTCTRDGNLDTLLAVYTGSSVEALAPLASDDDSSHDNCRASDSEVELSVVAGTTYRIAVDGKAGSSGDFRLSLQGTPANDQFENARLVNAYLTTASNRFAGKQPGEGDHAGNPGGASVWFKWTAPSSGPISIGACGSGTDTLLAVYTGAFLNALTPVASNDDAGGICGSRSQLSFDAVAGTTYRIAVDGKAGAQGALELLLYDLPSNDDFAAAHPLGSLTAGYQLGSTLLASKEPGEPNHAGSPGGHSVWFSWTPVVSGLAQVDACTNAFDPALAVYTGAALGALTPVATTDAGLGECAEGGIVEFAAVAGVTYRVALDGAAGEAGPFQLQLRPPVIHPRRLGVALAGAGTGTVGSAPAGIACSVSCAHWFAVGTTVTLVAAPRPGSHFAGWSGGGCSGLGPCQVSLAASAAVTASFEPGDGPAPGGGAGPSDGSSAPSDTGPSSGSSAPGDAGSAPAGAAPPAAPSPPKSSHRPLCKAGFKAKVANGKRRCVKKKAPRQKARQPR